MLKTLTILLTLVLLSPIHFAQKKTVLKPLGVSIIHKGQQNNPEILPLSKTLKQRTNHNTNITRNSSNSDNPLNLIDTLYTETNPITPGSNFGMFGQDRMVMWFQAPADLILKEVGFDWISINQPPPDIEVKIVELVKPREELEFLNDDWWGWYEANGNGFHDATAFLNDPDRTGPWVVSPQAPDPNETFGMDIWSDGGVGLPFTPSNDTTVVGVYQFIELIGLPYPVISAGTIFGVSVKNTAPLNASRVGIFGNPVGTGGTYQYTLWKYYADANTNAGQCPTLDCYGWWSRDITLLFAAVVEITGDQAPSINSFTELLSGIELGPFIVDANIIDTNPSGGTAGVASAYINFSIDGGVTWDSVAMTGAEPNFTGQIPIQSAGTTVEYYISATDVAGLFSSSSHSSFYIFAPTPGVTTLVIYNGFNSIAGYPQEYYWGPGVTFDHDSWAYGAVSSALLNNYTNIIEICLPSPADYNESVIRPWLEGDGNRNYFLAGQEWLGAKNGFRDSTYSAGSFEYDILGVMHSYNDVSFDGTAGQLLPSLVTPQAGTLFGQPLLDLFNSLTPAADSLMYNPVYELPDNNWIDGFDVVSGVEVDMMVETRGVGGIPNILTLPTLAHHTLPAGNKIIFHAYDPLSLNTAVDGTYPYYYWVGYDDSNSTYQASFNWFGIPLGVEETGGNIPKEFSISQNYPNPFNPTTKINFSVPTTSFVKLKVYDVLGKEVATLVNREMNGGNYEVDFDASNLASGLYIYKIQASSFSTSMKMMLLK